MDKLNFTSIDDIERRKEEEDRKELTKRISEDAKNIFEGIFPPKKPKKKNPFWGFMKWLGIISLLILLINLLLGNIWLLKTLIKDLFFSTW